MVLGVTSLTLLTAGRAFLFFACPAGSGDLCDAERASGAAGLPSVGEMCLVVLLQAW